MNKKEQINCDEELQEMEKTNFVYDEKVIEVFNKIEEINNNGDFLFENYNSKFWKYKNKYYSISKNHEDDGDVWCEETTEKELKENLEEVKENLQDDIERFVCSVRLNTLAISELYEEKIKLIGVKI